MSHDDAPPVNPVFFNREQLETAFSDVCRRWQEDPDLDPVVVARGLLEVGHTAVSTVWMLEHGMELSTEDARAALMTAATKNPGDQA